MIYLSTDYQHGLYWAKFLYFGVLFIPTTFYYFTVEFLGLERQRRRSLTVYSVSAVFLLVMLTSNRFLNGLYTYYWGQYVRAGSLQNVFLVFSALPMQVDWQISIKDIRKIQ